MSKTGSFLSITEIIFIVIEFLLMILKVLYYICEGTYALYVPRQKKHVSDEVVLITGAGQGIGRELAIGYANLGATVICWDIDKETNQQTMNEIKKMGKNLVYGYRCDVSDKNEIFEVAEKVKNEVGDVTILINNAGIAPCRIFQNFNTDEICNVIDVNLMAHYWTMKAFLPSMIEKNHGHVVAISSILATLSMENLSLYCSTKAAIRMFMESITKELRKGKSSVKLTTIFPGLVITGLTKTVKINNRFPCIIGLYTPQEAASLIIDAQRQDCKERSFPSFWLSITSLLKILPDKAQICIMDFIGIRFYEDD